MSSALTDPAVVYTNNRYRYYEGGVSSVYFWDLDDGFAGVVLLKKSMLPATNVPIKKATYTFGHSHTSGKKPRRLGFHPCV